MRSLTALWAIAALAGMATVSAEAQWLRIVGPSATGTRVLALGAKPGCLLAATTAGVTRSTDDGSTWVSGNNGLSGRIVYRFKILGTNIFAGTDSGVFCSTDNGNQWKIMSAGMSYNPSSAGLAIRALDGVGPNLVAGSYGSGIFRSGDSAVSWAASNVGLGNWAVEAMAMDDSVVFVGTAGDGVFRSTNRGQNWSASSNGIGLNDRFLRALGLTSATGGIGTTYFACSYNPRFGYPGAVYRTSNSGADWTPVTVPGIAQPVVNAFLGTGTTAFACIDSVLYRSRDDGGTWSPLGPLVGGSQLTALAVGAAWLLTGTSDGSVWRRSLVEITTVSAGPARHPSGFELNQNFPNPFNPSTTIRYGLSGRSHVRLTVFNTLGQQTTVLQEGEQPAGYHEVQFDGANLPSGVYFYRLQAGAFMETKRLLLMK